MAEFTRFVYAPKAYAFIFSRVDGKTIDVSNDIVAGSTQRLIDQPSKASITLRNDNFKYTGKFNPKFFPMDGITIWLQKVAGAPIQVFTGYIDSIPFFQAYPGTIEIKATCTLKQFMYTYFDPGIGFVEWMRKKNWAVEGDNKGNFTGIFNAGAFVDTLEDTGGSGNDGGMGQLLIDFLTEIGGFDESAIAIGNIPSSLPASMLKAYIKRVKASQAAENSLVPALKKFMTMDPNQSVQDAIDALNSDLPTTISATATAADIKQLIGAIANSGNAIKPTPTQIILAAVAMTGLNKEHSGTDKILVGYGNGYFAESPTLTIVGPNGPIKPLMSPASQGARFVDNFAEFARTSGGVGTFGRPAPGLSDYPTDDQIIEVAQVLSFRYGKERFYSQILEACRSTQALEVAKQVIDSINSNKNLDNVKSLSLVSAGSTVEQGAIAQVTWDSIFSIPEPDTVDLISIDSDGKTDGERMVVSTNQTYTGEWGTQMYRPPSDPINNAKFPQPDDGPITYSDIKYYMFSRGKRDGSKFVSVFDDSVVSVGQIVLVKSDSDKTCRCVYLGSIPLAYQTSPIALSEKATEVLGGKQTGLTFTFLGETVPVLGEGQLRADYIKSITPMLGTSAQTQNSASNLKINSADTDVYDKYYKDKSNQRLAEYFYVASTYDMHLLDHDPGGTKNNLNLYGSETSAMSFLRDLGIVSPSSTPNKLIMSGTSQSVPHKMSVTFSRGRTRFDIGFDLATAKASVVSVERSPSEQVSPSDPFAKTEVVVQIISGTTLPKPVWNGRSVLLPQSLIPGTDGDQSELGETMTWANLARMNTASAFTTLTSFPFDIVGSAFLVGEKSLMNDVPIMQGIQQFCQGSMRSFMSLPNGMFAAFYPDRFGVFGRKPYLQIRDLEIIDFNIVLNDEPLVTHMYVNGNTIMPTQSSVDQLDQVLSVGVITIDDVFSDGVNGPHFVNDPSALAGAGGNQNIDLINDAVPPAQWSQYYEDVSPTSKRFLETYGARPKVKNNPLIRSPWFEFVTAYNEFAFSWSAQTATTVDLTFMPELLAGGLVEFPEHNIIMFCESVSHTWSYESGFETAAYLSSPSTRNKDTDDEAVPGMIIFRQAS